MNIQRITVYTYREQIRPIRSDDKALFLYFMANFIHRFAFKMTQSRRRLLPIMRAGSLRGARARSGSLTASVYKQTTNHTLFYKLNRAVQRGQL